MRVSSTLAVVLGVMPVVCWAQSRPAAQHTTLSPSQLVREVAYNELHDHDRHGYWRYTIERHEQQETRVEDQIETADGPVAKLVKSNGVPLDSARQQAEQARLDHLLSSPLERAHSRQEHEEDEKRITRILTVCPDAFVFDMVGEEGAYHHLRFHPNPAFAVHSMESKVFHAMRGDLWIDARTKRLARVEGVLQSNVDFGFGILGRLNKGGWFRLQRTQVSATEWKTQTLEVHMNGSAMLLKNIARETSEVRAGFTQVGSNIDLAKGIDLLRTESSAMLAAPVVTSGGGRLRHVQSRH